MRDRRTEAVDRDRTGRGERDAVISSEELRDDHGTVRGTVTDRHIATGPTTAVRRETVRREPDRPGEVAIPEAYNLTRDRVRWGPIWAGVLTALTALLLLSLLGLAVGLTAVDAEAAARQGGLPLSMGLGAAIWGAISAILAFLLGGFVAGWTAAIFNRRWGALNGALVFLLAIPLILFLAGQGLGGILGTLGNYASALNVDLSQVRNAAEGAANQAGQAAQDVQPAEAGRVAENARNGAWGTLLGLLLGLGASALGGALGARRKLDVNRGTGQIED